MRYSGCMHLAPLTFSVETDERRAELMASPAESRA
jgi:hypothetical protein